MCGGRLPRIPSINICDGYPDCPHGEDEANCGHGGGSGRGAAGGARGRNWVIPDQNDGMFVRRIFGDRGQFYRSSNERQVNKPKTVDRNKIQRYKIGKQGRKNKGKVSRTGGGGTQAWPTTQYLTKKKSLSGCQLSPCLPGGGVGVSGGDAGGGAVVGGVGGVTNEDNIP